MRTLLSSFVAVGLLAAPAVQAQCVQPAERTAFDVAWLKSQLMVTAITCKQEDRYNAFVQRFRPELVNADRVVGSYFRRAHGSRSQAQHDNYTTQLAQDQAQLNLRQGDQFCNRRADMLDEVQSLRSGNELAEYAVAKGESQPIRVEACGGAASQSASTGGGSTHRGSTAPHRPARRS